jgi:hypothetical protein
LVNFKHNHGKSRRVILFFFDFGRLIKLDNYIKYLEEKRKKSIDELRDLWREKQLFLESKNLSEEMKVKFSKPEVLNLLPPPQIDFKSLDVALNGQEEVSVKDETLLEELNINLSQMNSPEAQELIRLLRLKKSM